MTKLETKIKTAINMMCQTETAMTYVDELTPGVLNGVNFHMPEVFQVNHLGSIGDEWFAIKGFACINNLKFFSDEYTYECCPDEKIDGKYVFNKIKSESWERIELGKVTEDEIFNSPLPSNGIVLLQVEENSTYSNYDNMYFDKVRNIQVVPYTDDDIAVVDKFLMERLEEHQKAIDEITAAL